jgi:hypothetical protein
LIWQDDWLPPEGEGNQEHEQEGGIYYLEGENIEEENQV